MAFRALGNAVARTISRRSVRASEAAILHQSPAGKSPMKNHIGGSLSTERGMLQDEASWKACGIPSTERAVLQEAAAWKGRGSVRATTLGMVEQMAASNSFGMRGTHTDGAESSMLPTCFSGRGPAGRHAELSGVLAVCFGLAFTGAWYFSPRSSKASAQEKKIC